MDIFKSELTNNTPLVLLDHNKNLIEFEGDSRPEDVQKFYSPIIEWLENYEKHLSSIKDNTSRKITTTCNFKFEYFNSSSVKYVMDIILKLGEITTSNGVLLVLNWYYDEQDEDMKESGEEFEDMLDIKFNYHSIAE